ncbi:MAG TPA: threonine-phosphate decarboxylase CobD [Dissulfurispiraceae bacterium]|nr:threonine-phosphate decarboxylase CobD [Dissulfurispiraceae bacterium]
MTRTLAHGGNVHAAARRLGVGTGHILDLSASINPLGMPRSVQTALRRDLTAATHYPDPDMVELTAALAKYHGLPSETLLCGNGSTELIYLIARALRPAAALIPAPTFTEYERAIKASRTSEAGSEKHGIFYFHLKEKTGFRIDPDEFIESMAKMVSTLSLRHSRRSAMPVAFLCNPNNPTGVVTPREDVLRIAHAAKKFCCYLVVDEAFIDFCQEHSGIDAVVSNPYLIVLRSMTKFYALAGIRLGYGAFPAPVARLIQAVREPWTVSTIAQIAGLSALQDTSYRARTLRLIAREKRFLEHSFKRLQIPVVPSGTNFYLLKMRNAAALADALSQKGILVRSCANFRGLASGHVRIAVRSHRENIRFLEELNACRA